MKTDLAKILSVSGHHGLFRYLAQSRSGAIVESLSDGRRTSFDANSKITSLADIAIFTTAGELKLKEVFLKLKDAVGDKDYSNQAYWDGFALSQNCVYTYSFDITSDIDLTADIIYSFLSFII